MAAELVGLGCAAVLAVRVAGDGAWKPALLVTLAGFSVFGDLRAIEAGTKVKISGSFLSLVLAMVFLGGAQAALIGVVTIAICWFRWRESPSDLVNNLLAYAWFPLLGGLVFHAVASGTGTGQTDGLFYVLVFATFLFALGVNFLLIAAHRWLVEGDTIVLQFRKLVVPVFSSEVAVALVAAGTAFLYVHLGLAAIALFGVVLFTYQHLIARMLVAEQQADELRRRTTQLATLQVGMLSALLHTLDLRDRMTARHSAAVARYAKAIAKSVGCTEEEQELVHTAGLLHDIGKFVFPDRILKGDHKLTDEDWAIIRMHPAEGSRIVSQIEGYGPVGEIILAHHERVDGKGYPRQLTGDDIPLLSRMISVSDIYDVMTARDSYRDPVSSAEAIAELKRVSGTQLDGRLVEVFIETLENGEVGYRHGEDADFDAELALDKRIHDYASPVIPAAELEVAQPSGETPASGYPVPAGELAGSGAQGLHRNPGRRRRGPSHPGARDHAEVGG
jgi:putative nucleotidyltransferase with HDIG domain